MVFEVYQENTSRHLVLQQRQRIFEKNGEKYLCIRYVFSSDGIYEYHYTGVKVYFYIPVSGIYRIETWGARGGSSSNSTGPKGAYSKSIVSLQKDEKIEILVGEKGWSGHSTSTPNCGGGGGGTFVAKNNKPLCVAGGGGSFTAHSCSQVSSFACGQETQLGGDPGTGKGELKMGGKSGGSLGGGGGGFEGNGENATTNGKGGNSFINGGERQTLGTGYSNTAYGGFGGGGSNHGNCGSGAGGGGYTGGSASIYTSIQGGGGGSYFEGSDFQNESPIAISGCNSSIPENPGTDGNGFARFTLLKSTQKGALKIQCICYKRRVLWTLFCTLPST